VFDSGSTLVILVGLCVIRDRFVWIVYDSGSTFVRLVGFCVIRGRCW
jgi:hypothetical protein